MKMYTFDGRIRYSEIDSDGKLTMESLIDYFQDCSTFQSEDLGIGIKFFQEKHMAWVLSSWQIVVNRMPELGEKIKTGTSPYELKGFMGIRNFCMKTEEGEMLALANSIWTLMDIDAMRPMRIPPNISECYVLEERLPMDYAPRKIAVDFEGAVLGEEIIVRKHHLDTNCHVNNGQYIRMAMDCIGEEPIRQLRAEYKKSAVLGDVIYPRIIRKPGKDTIILSSEQADAPYCIVELERL